MIVTGSMLTNPALRAALRQAVRDHGATLLGANGGADPILRALTGPGGRSELRREIEARQALQQRAKR